MDECRSHCMMVTGLAGDLEAGKKSWFRHKSWNREWLFSTPSVCGISSPTRNQWKQWKRAKTAEAAIPSKVFGIFTVCIGVLRTRREGERRVNADVISEGAVGTQARFRSHAALVDAVTKSMLHGWVPSALTKITQSLHASDALFINTDNVSLKPGFVNTSKALRISVESVFSINLGK